MNRAPDPAGLARTLMVIAALVLLPACVTEKPVVEATGVPVGDGVDGR